MIGKQIGKDNIYIHKSAMFTLPIKLLTRVRKGMKKVPKNWDFNFIVTHPMYIAYVQAENFDKVYEPVLGARYKYTDNGKVVFVPRPYKPRVLHQRWKTVKPDYRGFNIKDDIKREKWYKQFFSARDMSGLGFKHKWKRALSDLEDDYGEIY